MDEAIREIISKEFFNKKVYINNLNKALEKYGMNYNRGGYLQQKLSDEIKEEIKQHNLSFNFKHKKINVSKIYPEANFSFINNKYRVELFRNKKDYLNRFIRIVNDENLESTAYIGNLDDIPLFVFSRTHNTKIKKDWIEKHNEEYKYIII